MQHLRKFKILGIAILILATGFLFIHSSSNDSEKLRRELLLKVITFAIDNGHYQPMEMNDEYSEKAFKLYLERLDYGKRFLIEDDVKNLEKYRKDIDNEIASDNFDLLDFATSLLNKRTNEVQGFYKDLLKAPFDFDKEETYQFDPDKIGFAKNDAELKDRWRKVLKYETLTRIYDAKKAQDKAAEKSDTVTIKSFAALEKDARGKVQKRYEDYFHRLSQLNDDDQLDTYMNALVNVYDPHTEYFPPKDKENFDIQFSGQLEGIGAQLTQKNAYIEVNKIIPGSPSWKLGEPEVGDLILKVAQENQEPVDVVDMRLDDAVLLIRGKKGTKVTLTLKKPDGIVKNITLTRDVVVLEETYAKSAVIDDSETHKKIGYLKLPSFYVDFSEINGRNCFDDVADEIAKLKEENVEGIIFDLRDNGGGSLEDVVKIAGLFIQDGPIVQAKGRKGSIKIYKDTDPDIQYGGPLIVMVNATSASASEIFAAAMQDYNRAVIIGGNSTFGKGTVQNFTELDRMVPKKPADMKDLGSLKMTIQKFYRINGGATQLKGVIPDIIYPDYYNFMEIGEKDLDDAMPWDEISPLTYTKWTPLYDKEYIDKLSETRIKSDSIFILINENGKRLKELRDESELSLNFAKYSEITSKREQEAKKFDRIGKDTLGLAIDMLKADRPEILADTSKRAREDAWILSLKKDIYLSEATNIMKNIEEYDVEHAGKMN